jgi:hypothetical protein
MSAGFRPLARLLRKGVPGGLIDRVEDAIDGLRMKLNANDVALMDLVIRARNFNERKCSKCSKLDLDALFRRMPTPMYAGLNGYLARTLGMAA